MKWNSPETRATGATDNEPEWLLSSNASLLNGVLAKFHLLLLIKFWNVLHGNRNEEIEDVMKKVFKVRVNWEFFPLCLPGPSGAILQSAPCRTHGWAGAGRGGGG